MILKLAILLIAQISYATEINYDEDMSLPVPEVILNHSPINEPAPQFLGRLHNCACREHPGKYVACFGDHCKEFPASLNITAPLFKLKLSSIVVLKSDDLLLYSNLHVLEIESNLLLEHIEPGIFRPMGNLQNLTIAFNERLSYLDEKVFEGLVNLSTLCLQKNGFTKVIDITKTLSPQYVPKLFLLNLNENIFHEVGSSDFQPMIGTKLEQLNMVLCEIDFIASDSLVPLKYLSSLRVGQNHFNSSVLARVIEKCTEKGVPLDNLNLYGMNFRKEPPLDLLLAVGKSNVRFLHLIVNHFDQLENDAFPYMPNLIQISLRGNNIMDIAPNAFKRIPKLESLLLTVNRLTQVPEAVILPTIKELDIAGNTYNSYYPSYFYMPDEIFKNMTNLRYLTLSYNNICFLTKSSFVGLTNLIKLNLKSGSITLIRSGAFLPLGNLTLLNLINNPFPRYMFLKADIFQGLTNLQVLLLGGCSFRNLSMTPSLFTFTPNLKYLGLERNELFAIGPQQFAPLTRLKTLNINENKLPSWNKRILGSNSTLVTMAAVSNKFTFVSNAMLEDWLSLEILSLDGNPFRCDCSLYSVVLWSKTHKDLLKFRSTEETTATCFSPANWRHKPIVSFLNTLNIDGSVCETSGHISLEVIICLGILFSSLLIVAVLGYVYRYDVAYWMFKIRLNIRFGRKNEPGNYDWDVYVSCSPSDEWFTAELIAKLEPELKLCVAERDLIAGDVKSAAVASAVAASRRPLLVVSEEFAKSSWCRWETQLVARRSPIVVQVERVDAQNASSLLRYLLRTRIYILWPREDDRHARDVFWQKLKIALSPEP